MSKNIRNNGRTNGFELQGLESRVMMSAAKAVKAAPVKVIKPVALAVAEVVVTGGTQLKITGTSGNDQITLTETINGLVITNTGGWTVTKTGTYTNIKIDGAAGNDIITVSSSVTLNCDILGGAGNDTITGGAGNDIINGGAGNNTLAGCDGDDTLVTTGSTNDMLVGGNGNDSFWTDNNTKQTTDADATEISEGALHRIAAFKGGVVKTASVKLVDPKTTSTSFKYHNFADRPLFGAGGPSENDIQQGQVGDCYFLSTVASVTKVDPTKIRESIADMGDGTYAVKFNATYVRVDSDLATYSWSATTPAYANLGHDNSMWVAIMEKAFTEFRKSANTYASISSGLMSEVYSDFGVHSTSINATGNANSYVAQIKALLDAGDSVTAACYTVPAGTNLVGSHAYTVDHVVDNGDGTFSVVVRNPWGVDGYSSNDGSNDGYVTLTATQAFAGLNMISSAAV